MIKQTKKKLNKTKKKKKTTKVFQISQNRENSTAA